MDHKILLILFMLGKELHPGSSGNLSPALSSSLAWALIQRTGLLAALIHSPKVYNTASVKVVPNGVSQT
jgi:hypothetical protein